MKPIIQKIWMVMALLCASLTATALKFESDGLWYTILSENDRTVEVTEDERYNGYPYEKVIIPQEVIHDSKTYTVISIGESAFSQCKYLTSVTIPNSVTSIGEFAFNDCSSLTSVRIPNSMTLIGSVTIPNSVTSIGERAFCDCSSLTSVTIPNSVTSIGHEAFCYCSSLTSVTISNSLPFIEAGTFSYCSSLTSVTIPNSVTSIGHRAFIGCSSLTSVTIPNSVTSIGHEAFWDCSSLTSVTIPNSVTYIEAGTFYGCSSLTSVTIPNSVYGIGENAFGGCDNLKNIYMQREVPMIHAWEAFSYKQYEETILFVPTGTKTEYEKVYPWEKFRNIEEMDFSGVDGIDADEYETPHISVNNGILTIDGISNHERITVYDMHGRIFYNGTSHIIDHLPSGLYICKAGWMTVKISI